MAIYQRASVLRCTCRELKR